VPELCWFIRQEILIAHIGLDDAQVVKYRGIRIVAEEDASAGLRG
jgi:hypothetical protein